MGNGVFAKPPDNAYDSNGPKSPGKPGLGDGFQDPKGGENWVPNPNPGKGAGSHGWQDSKGNVWIPTGRGGRAHGGPHWDVQTPGGGNRNVRPLQHQ
ncbi:polymorphic toxin type 37 domain-containing protein [Pseudomonas fluorescens]|uniref:polymorphic toxin type 37 domain-containing protein n=1 Tax=Pseudomonas fluorescens TaxID=294 RepID=UPI001CD60530|nr:polymorphic toxin type 37 domain-containing protein [Pseudomonas fluorescens]